jgi:predicted secreted hydrolase
MKGKLIIEGKEYEVDGNCWLDRQFSPVADGLDAWDETLFGSSKWAWMGIILSNGEAISLWEIVDHNDNRNIFASILYADGTQIVTSAKSIIDSATDKWESKVTGQNYPTKWIVDIPEVNAHLTVTCNPKEQEIVSELAINNKYEAMSIVIGTYAGEAVTGDCCLEIIGNWKK